MLFDYTLCGARARPAFDWDGLIAQRAGITRWLSRNVFLAHVSYIGHLYWRESNRVVLSDMRLEGGRSMEDRFEVSPLTWCTYPGASCPMALRFMIPPSLPAPITFCRKHTIFVRAHVWLQIFKNVFPVQVSVRTNALESSRTLVFSISILTSIQLQTSCLKLCEHKKDRGTHRH